MLLLARLYGVGGVVFLGGFVFFFLARMYVVGISLCYFWQKCMFQLYCLLLNVTRYIISRYICFKLDMCCSRLECLLLAGLHCLQEHVYCQIYVLLLLRVCCLQKCFVLKRCMSWCWKESVFLTGISLAGVCRCRL